MLFFLDFVENRGGQKEKTSDKSDIHRRHEGDRGKRDVTPKTESFSLFLLNHLRQIFTRYVLLIFRRISTRQIRSNEHTTAGMRETEGRDEKPNATRESSAQS